MNEISGDFTEQQTVQNSSKQESVEENQLFVGIIEMSKQDQDKEGQIII